MTDRGAYVSTDDFFSDRRDWLSVHVVEVQPGAYDVVLKIDGTYFNRDDAIEVGVSFHRDLRYLLDRLDPDRMLVPPNNARPACPVCARPSVLVPSLDRYMHIDGSANDVCWRAMLQNEGNASEPA
ncbi:hypothetical protein [Nocardia amamiensis]|uniref:hypothetical protein n=1 Tax=Nocardia amamiensis TaxID=404578 RepID=UPI0033C21DA7